MTNHELGEVPRLQSRVSSKANSADHGDSDDDDDDNDDKKTEQVGVVTQSSKFF